jgi:phage terminase small subunit
MLELQPRHEAFCRAYAAHPNGAAAARLAGYAATHAANQAHALLKRPDVAARVAELSALSAERRAAELSAEQARAEDLARERAEAARGLIAKLEPVYAACLDAADYDSVLQTVELQARIAGFVSGGATVRPRAGRPEPEGMTHEQALDELDL